MTGKKRKQDDEQAEAVLSALGHVRAAASCGCCWATRRQPARRRRPAGSTPPSAMSATTSGCWPGPGRSKAARERPVRGSVQHFYRVNPAVAEMPMVTEVLAVTSNDDK